MNLGKKIYEQRIKKNLSQGDLANLLNVSRQSVSKWENNNTVPDLEKMIKLSEIFEISLDELVKGEKSSSNNNVQVIKEVVIQEPKREGRKTAGTVLFCMAFLTFLIIFMLSGSIGGILFAIPFLVCGTICFLANKNVGLWCAWAVYLLADLYIRWATGITIGLVRLTLIYTPDMNYARLIIAWIILFVTLLIMGITILRFSKSPLKPDVHHKKYLLTGWTVFLVVVVLHQLFLHSEFHVNLLHYVISVPLAYTMTSMLIEWIGRGILIFLIIYTLRYRRYLHQNESMSHA